ncbi:tetratricopeptide repeat protein [Planctomycetota bacterium]
MRLSKNLSFGFIVTLLILLIGSLVYIRNLKVQNSYFNQRESDYIARINDLETIINKNQTAFYYNLAIIYRENQQYEKAIEEYKKVLGTNPTDYDVHYNLGIVYDEHLHQPQKAIKYYQKYLEYAPANASNREVVKKWLENCQNQLRDNE